jgi:putative phosphoesterase
MTQVVQLSSRKFLTHHIVNPHQLSDSLRECIGHEQPDVVVFGHTHKPFCQQIDGRLYFNPGYAGKSRFGMERTVAILDCQPEMIKHEYFKL